MYMLNPLIRGESRGLLKNFMQYLTKKGNNLSENCTLQYLVQLAPVGLVILTGLLFFIELSILVIEYL